LHRQFTTLAKRHDADSKSASDGGADNEAESIDACDTVYLTILKWRSQILDKLTEAFRIRKHWSNVIAITACRRVNQL
jgi:hypothetical protein